jgi:hypothetical protein
MEALDATGEAAPPNMEALDATEIIQANEASPQQAAGYHKEGHCL